MEFNKKWMGADLNALATQRALDQIAIEGQELPCKVVSVVSSGIVKVSFEVDSAPTTLPQVIVPVAMSPYVRLPIKAGDPGYCAAASVVLGGVSGLGSGLPKFGVRPANLAALIFNPIATTTLASVDLTALVLFDQTQQHSVAVTGDGVVIDGNVTVTPDELAFFGGSPAAIQSITGALSAVTDSHAKAVLTSIIAMITAYNLGQNNTT